MTTHRFKDETCYWEDIKGNEIEIKYSCHFWEESNWGCDADGNRGMAVSDSEIDDWEVVGVDINLDDHTIKCIEECIEDAMEELSI